MPPVSTPGERHVCQGIDCSTDGFIKPGLQTYKPTKQERLRIQQGEKPYFGDDRMIISTNPM